MLNSDLVEIPVTPACGVLQIPPNKVHSQVMVPTSPESSDLICARAEVERLRRGNAALLAQLAKWEALIATQADEIAGLERAFASVDQAVADVGYYKP